MPDLWTALVHGDWGAAAVFGFFALALGETARRGWSAPDALYQRYHEDRARTKTALDEDRIFPEVARLVAEVNTEVAQSLGVAQQLTDAETLADALTDSQTLMDNLQWAGYRP